MYTTGLVLVLSEDPALAIAALGELEAAGPFTVGEPRGACRPAVLQTADPEAAHEWHDWAAARPGVAGLEVVFVHWDEADAEAPHARS